MKDFISIDKIKEALIDTKNEHIQCIYLTGAEPMTHPEFNSILRLCLQYNNVCICTNASFINEKKARFLKKVEDEGKNEIIFMLSLAHFNEIQNDNIRSRGSFRQTFNAVKCLIKYGFNPVFNIMNYYDEPKNVLIEEVNKICDKIGFETTEFNFKINKYFDPFNKDQSDNIEFNDETQTDCKRSRILTSKGVYACPFLANDHRGRMGNDFKDFSKKMYLETSYCETCCKNKSQMFGINFSLLS
jgi:hypothetical protein